LINNTIALDTASKGLERLMVGSKQKGVIDDGGTVQKISAGLYYQAQVMGAMTTEDCISQGYSNKIFKRIKFDLEEFVDMQARSKPLSLHHVYEWGKVGNSEARLFEITKSKQSGFNFTLSYDFKISNSSVPSKGKNPKRYVFKNKAFVMENAQQVTIRPKNPNTGLTFNIGGQFITLSAGRAVKINNPGGKEVKLSFANTYKRFMNSQVENSIAMSGAKESFNFVVSNSMRLPGFIKAKSYSYNPASVKSAAKAAVQLNGRNM
jgi:hypothetical protein